MGFDYFGVVEKPPVSAFQRRQIHQNPLSIDPVQGHIMIWSRWDKDSAATLIEHMTYPIVKDGYPDARSLRTT